jgi:hypothetical protein
MTVFPQIVLSRVSARSRSMKSRSARYANRTLTKRSLLEDRRNLPRPIAFRAGVCIIAIICFDGIAMRHCLLRLFGSKMITYLRSYTGGPLRARMSEAGDSLASAVDKPFLDSSGRRVFWSRCYNSGQCSGKGAGRAANSAGLR